MRLAGTSGVEVLHNSFLRCGLAVSAGVELAALQLWDSTTAAGQLIQNANVQLMNNLIVTAPLSAQPALSITSQQPWSGGASVPGVAWASASLQNNLMYKDPSSEPVSYASLFYSMNSNVGAAANSGFGSLSVGSSVPYVLDSGLPWPHRYSVASWNTQRSVSNAVGNPGLDAAYTPGAGQLAGPGRSRVQLCERGCRPAWPPARVQRCLHWCIRVYCCCACSCLRQCCSGRALAWCLSVSSC